MPEPTESPNPWNQGWAPEASVLTVTSMTRTQKPTDAGNGRDDLFTSIHKALRFALFDITARAGSTDWGDADEVKAVRGKWLPLLDLLRVHTAHEERHIFRLLDEADPLFAGRVEEQHGDIDDLLDDLEGQFDAVTEDPARGLRLYRDLSRFVASYLPHLHDEETMVMARIWECCSDEEIGAARQGFMSETSPSQLATTVEYMLPALDKVGRRELVQGLAAGAPRPVLEMVLGIAEWVLPPDEYRVLRAVA
jgi:hemerythrin-like domain-containing protein